MDKKMLVVVAIIASLIIGSVAFLLSQKSTDKTTQPLPTQNTKTEPTSSSPTDKATGRYITYSKDEVAATSDTKVLFFHAPWCPQCRALEASIEAGPIPDGVTIFKVDYDSSQELRQRYGVTIQTTLVRIDDKGELVKKYVSYDEPTLAAVTESLLR